MPQSTAAPSSKSFLINYLIFLIFYYIVLQCNMHRGDWDMGRIRGGAGMTPGSQGYASLAPPRSSVMVQHPTFSDLSGGWPWRLPEIRAFAQTCLSSIVQRRGRIGQAQSYSVKPSRPFSFPAVRVNSHIMSGSRGRAAALYSGLHEVRPAGLMRAP